MIIKKGIKDRERNKGADSETMKYDYLIVGAGLFGAVFAYEARKRGKSCLVVEKRNHIAGSIVRIFMESKYTSTGRIFSIPLTRKYGSMSISLRNSIIISMLPLRAIRMSCTTCLSI